MVHQYNFPLEVWSPRIGLTKHMTHLSSELIKSISIAGARHQTRSLRHTWQPLGQPTRHRVLPCNRELAETESHPSDTTVPLEGPIRRHAVQR